LVKFAVRQKADGTTIRRCTGCHWNVEKKEKEKEKRRKKRKKKENFESAFLFFSFCLSVAHGRTDRQTNRQINTRKYPRSFDARDIQSSSEPFIEPRGLYIYVSRLGASMSENEMKFVVRCSPADKGQCRNSDVKSNDMGFSTRTRFVR
jgi:hypothetical protein